ncbi:MULTISPECIES: MBOAT family protein [unclassified Polaromonas]|uniref:MBOAT family O-acyltransferase n=1 Tax=unclassified Polaromonas TaxID=2638319 RepID=UPI000F09531B|nr:MULTISPECIES: MBOAT family protein [unclassified Polaromonas]AYQ30034.1 MBOAT family protein [Polaromonas sp. SP1]QGJ18852.1 MBOAT family protein [Polaromonas sp. Pch-P]
MLFNSYVFIFGFLPITLFGFFFLGRTSHRLAALWLAAVSLFFYGWWDERYVGLLLASIAFNFGAGFLIGRSVRQNHGTSGRRSKVMLASAIAVNLVFLVYFKYANFFVDNLNQVTGGVWTLTNVVLPLGISFFTFTQIAYLVDTYQGKVKEFNFIHYTLFVTYFPHLIAGPVLHHKQMMPQFRHSVTYRISLENFNIGLTIFIIGLAKKVLLADQFALYANPVFNAAALGGEPKVFEAWIGALAYALQLYFDFSGYSDMAIGLSRMLNIKLPLNFDSPYKAPNIIEFWRRWHMTLSTFLRDYLYVPLGGSRKGVPRRYVNLMITMLLGGLWHGAGWTFVLWGGLHGVYLVINHGWRNLTGACVAATGWRAVAGIGLTFVVVVVAWVPFRAPDMEVALRMWAGMVGVNGMSLPSSFESRLPGFFSMFTVFEGLTPMAALKNWDVLLAIPIGLAIVWGLPNTQQWMSRYDPALDLVPVTRLTWKLSRVCGVAAGVLFALSLLMLTRESAFLYFQF